MHTITRYFRNCCFLLGWAALCNGCVPKPWIPKSFGPMTVSLSGIFPNCHSTVNGSQIMSYKGVVQVYYLTPGGDRRAGSAETFTSATTPTTSMNVTASIPSDGSHYDLEIIIEGTQCSTCALTQYGPDICNQVNVSNGRTAAKPRLDYQTGTFVSYQTTYSKNLAGQPFAPNVANSCGCVVPY